MEQQNSSSSQRLSPILGGGLILVFLGFIVLLIFGVPKLHGVSPEYGNAIIYVAFGSFSLIASIVLFRFLKSTGVAKGKQYQFGGAAALFVVTLSMLIWRFDNASVSAIEKEISFTGTVYTDKRLASNAQVLIIGSGIQPVATNNFGEFRIELPEDKKRQVYNFQVSLSTQTGPLSDTFKVKHEQRSDLEFHLKKAGLAENPDKKRDGRKQEKSKAFLPEREDKQAALEVEFTAWGSESEKSSQFQVTEGAVLRTGYGVQLRFRTNNACYVYLVMYDSQGKASSLFPENTNTLNKIEGGKEYVVPTRDGEAAEFFLDANTGKERIYLLAAYEPMTDIVKRLEQLKRGDALVQSNKLKSDIHKLAEIGRSRGFGGVRKHIKSFKLKNDETLDAEIDVAFGDALVVKSIGFEHR